MSADSNKNGSRPDVAEVLALTDRLLHRNRRSGNAISPAQLADRYAATPPTPIPPPPRTPAVVDSHTAPGENAASNAAPETASGAGDAATSSSENAPASDDEQPETPEDAIPRAPPPTPTAAPKLPPEPAVPEVDSGTWWDDLEALPTMGDVRSASAVENKNTKTDPRPPEAPPLKVVELSTSAVTTVTWAPSELDALQRGRALFADTAPVPPADLKVAMPLVTMKTDLIADFDSRLLEARSPELQTPTAEVPTDEVTSPPEAAVPVVDDVQSEPEVEAVALFSGDEDEDWDDLADPTSWTDIDQSLNRRNEELTSIPLGKTEDESDDASGLPFPSARGEWRRLGTTLAQGKKVRGDPAADLQPLPEEVMRYYFDLLDLLLAQDSPLSPKSVVPPKPRPGTVAPRPVTPIVPTAPAAPAAPADSAAPVSITPAVDAAIAEIEAELRAEQDRNGERLTQPSKPLDTTTNKDGAVANPDSGKEEQSAEEQPVLAQAEDDEEFPVLTDVVEDIDAELNAAGDQ